MVRFRAMLERHHRPGAVRVSPGGGDFRVNALWVIVPALGFLGLFLLVVLR